MFETRQAPDDGQIQGLVQVGDESPSPSVRRSHRPNARAVKEYKAGKERAIAP